MNTARVTALRKQVNSLFRNNPEGSVIELVVNNKVVGDYEIPVNHYVSLDSKTPTQWLNGCICFEVDLKGIKNAKVNLQMRR